MKKIRIGCRFFGRVQGVGFRYQACHAANALGITGWVRNIWDDSVEMEIQGDPDSIENLIRRMYRIRFAHIDRLEQTELPVIAESSFQILD